MMILAEMDPNTAPTTLLGFGCLALLLLLKDWATLRSRNIRDDKKVDELSAQTKLLTEVRDGLQYDRVKQKKFGKRIKVMASQVNDIHQNQVKPKQVK